MATTDARPIPLKNTAYRLYFAIYDTAGALVTSWTGADSESSGDGFQTDNTTPGFSDCTNEATELGTSGVGYLELTADEMNHDCVAVKVTVTNTNAVPVVITLYPQEADDIKVSTNYWLNNLVSTPNTAGVPLVDVGRINNSTTAASNLALSAGIMAVGTATSGTQTTTVITSSDIDALVANNDTIIGAQLIVTASTAHKYTRCRIADYSVTAGIATITLDANTPLYGSGLTNGDTFIIV